MTMASLPHFTRFGLRAIACIPFGLHELMCLCSRSIKKQEGPTV
jgi:hypothetical protein